FNNVGQTSTVSGTDQTQNITTMSDGTFVTAYNIGGSLRAQQYDQFGNALGGEITLATNSLGDAVPIEILGVENNILIVAYPMLSPNGTTQVQSFSIVDGVATQTNDVSHQLSISGNADDNREPSLTGTSLADLQVHLLLDTGTPATSVVTFADLDTATPTQTSTEILFGQNSEQTAEILSNGNRLIAVDSDGAGASPTNAIEFVIIAPDGTEVASGTSISADQGAVAEPNSAALTGGGFVLVYRSFQNTAAVNNDNDINIHIFDANGVEVTPVFDVMAGLDFGNNNGDRNRDPDVVALSDGGFIVFWERNNTDETGMLGRRYDASGTALGDAFTVAVAAGGNFGDPVATLLDNGLVAVSFTNNTFVETALIATEELDIVLTDADETITGTSGDDIIEGAGGADSLDGGDGIDTLSFANAEEAVVLSLASNSGSAGDANGDTYANFENVIGSDFDDTIAGDFGTNIILAGAGDDRVITRSSGDTLDGGDGIDTLELRDFGAFVDLELGTIDFQDSIDAGVILNFENVIGSDSLDNIFGDGGDNSIAGNAGADSIEGRAGDDTLSGGDGDDTIDGGAGADQIQGGVGADTLRGGDGNDAIVANTFNDRFGSTQGDEISGDAGDDTLGGADGADDISGGTGDDQIIGRGGNDQIAGDAGNDDILGGTGGDTVSGGTGDDTIQGGDGEDDISGGDGTDTLFGGADRDVIFGDGEENAIEGDDSIEGGDGLDVIFGGGGNDIIFTNTAADTEGTEFDDGGSNGLGNSTAIVGGLSEIGILEFVDGGAGQDQITGSANIDFVTAGNDDDVVFGGGGNDILSGDTGDDQIFGGVGNDAIIGDSFSQGVSVFFDSGAASNLGSDIQSLLNDLRDESVEGEFFVHLDNDDRIEGGDGNDLIGGGNGADTVFGDAGDDTIFGDEGKDRLIGGAGADVIDGGDDNDTIEGGAGGDFIDGGQGHDTIIGENGNDNLDGDSGRDTIDGGSGSDTIFGGAGRDMLFGGDDDTLDQIFGGSGADEIFAGNGGGQFFGENGADTITGGTGEDDIDGGSGRDEIFGGNGNDTLKGQLGDDLLFGGNGADSIWGGIGDDTIDGGDGDDTLSGDFTEAGTPEGGDDLFIGGAGNDAMFGGAGFDTVDYSASGAGIEVVLDQSTTSVGTGFGGDAQGDELTSIESIIGTAFIDNITGNVKDNVFFGGAGNDLLSGAEGDDELYGGAGADLLIGGDDDDVIDGGADDDTVRLDGDRAEFQIVDQGNGQVTVIHSETGDTDTITNVEIYSFDDQTINLADLFDPVATDDDDVLTGTNGDDVINGLGGNDTVNGLAGNDTLNGGADADELNGGDDADVLNGNGGADLLNGNGGNDELNGGAGKDELNGDTGADVLNGSNGADILSGDAGADVLNGGNGADTLDGGTGVDAINGGNGNDVLTGGAGLDVFIFEDGFGKDTITDFATFNNEDIDLSAVSEIVDFADLAANHMTQVGSDVVIDDGTGNTITVQGFDLSDLQAGDFLF
ncbi:MAG: calcium-binding protein, partial [Paracoccaceae bacterium]